MTPTNYCDARSWEKDQEIRRQSPTLSGWTIVRWAENALLRKVSLFGAQAIILHATDLDVNLAPSTVRGIAQRLVTQEIEVAQVAGDGLKDFFNLVGFFDAISEATSVFA